MKTGSDERCGAGQGAAHDWIRRWAKELVTPGGDGPAPANHAWISGEAPKDGGDLREALFRLLRWQENWRKEGEPMHGGLDRVMELLIKNREMDPRARHEKGELSHIAAIWGCGRTLAAIAIVDPELMLSKTHEPSGVNAIGMAFARKNSDAARGACLAMPLGLARRACEEASGQLANRPDIASEEDAKELAAFGAMLLRQEMDLIARPPSAEGSGGRRI